MTSSTEYNEESPIAEASVPSDPTGSSVAPEAAATVSDSPRPPAVNIAEWRDLEPSDPTDARDHVEMIVVTASSGWRLVGASLRGKLHAHHGEYREDAFVLGDAGRWHCVAVADGAGSSDLARVGSQLACEAAMGAMRRVIATATDGDAQSTARGALASALEEATQRIADEAERRQVPITELSTTLLLVMHRPTRPHVVATAEVGDGAVAVETCDANHTTIAKTSDSGEFLGETTSFSPPDLGAASNRIQVHTYEGVDVIETDDRGDYSAETRFLSSRDLGVVSDRIRVHTYNHVGMIAVMTDGVADDMIPYEANIRRMFRTLNREVVSARDRSPEEQLLSLLAYERRGSFDDRTMVIVYPDHADAEAHW